VKNPENYSEQEIQACIDLLETLATDGAHLAQLTEEQRIGLYTAAGKLSRPDKDSLDKRNKEIRKARRQKTVLKEKKARAGTAIRQTREAKVFSAQKLVTDQRADGEYKELLSPRNCYICKAEYTKLHFFYDSMCPSCAEYNYSKRFQAADLKGNVALITGGRLKIGYQAALMMLRAGAHVIVTTRFSVDAALRFSREEDFSAWENRLDIFGLDLRHTPSVELFARFISEKYPRLDILINNAAQTVRRPPGFYLHLMENETKPAESLPAEIKPLLAKYHSCIQRLSDNSIKTVSVDPAMAISANTVGAGIPGIGLYAPARLSQIPYTYDNTEAENTLFPAGKLDADLQQVDLRTTNSWRLVLGEVPAVEVIELQLINSIAPFVLCNRLIHLMKRDYTGKKHIINVSAMEGKFLRFEKGARHPHTNMAKASLNMFTHTSAAELAKDGIHMNAVDTGWVTDEDPAALAFLKQDLHDFQPPLDIVDGAARVCDPFFSGISTGKHMYGKFLKDYFPIDW